MTPKGMLILNGGDAFAPECTQAHRDWLRRLRRDGSRPRLIVVPTAEMQRPQKMADKAMRYFRAMGTFAEYTLIQDTTSANTPADYAVINKMEAVVLLDGSPLDVVERLRGTKTDKALRAVLDRTAALVGIGASAMALGACLWLDNTWQPALGVVPELAILPRHDHIRMRFEPARLLRELPNGVTLVGVDTQTFLTRYPGGDCDVSGTGTVTVYHSVEQQITYAAGQRFVLPASPTPPAHEQNGSQSD